MHTMARSTRHCLPVLFALLLGCQGGQSETLPRAAQPSPYFAAAVKVSVVPNQSQIEGEEEPRLGGQTTLQNFHLGGFGIGPLQTFPDPINVDLTEPAGAPVHVNEQGLEEPTYLRLMLLRDERNGAQVSFVSLDAVGAGNLIQQQVKQAIVEVIGGAVEDVLFGQTHTHAGADLQGLWGGVPQSWVADLVTAASQAASQAQAALEPARLTLQQAELDAFNNYRRPRVDIDAEADLTASLLRAWAADDDRVVGSVLQYNAHPTSVGTGEDPRVPHADYIHGAMETLEADGGSAVYFNGPIADASPSGGSCEGTVYIRVYCRGAELANAILQAPMLTLDGELSSRHATVYLPITNPIFLAAGLIGSFNRYYNFTELPIAELPLLGDELLNLPQAAPYAVTTVSRVSLGEQLEIVTMPGEATNTFGEYIQRLAGPTPVMLLGLTHNSFGYIIPEEEFSYIDETGDAGFTLPFTSYEEYVSMGPLTAPLLRMQAYAPLFDAEPLAYAPPSLVACAQAQDQQRCYLQAIVDRLGYIQRGYYQRCIDTFGEDNAFCALLAPTGAERGGLLNVEFQY